MLTEIKQELHRFCAEELHNQVLFGSFIQDKLKDGWQLKFMHISEELRVGILIFEKTSFIYSEDEYLF
jgi:hypothetical protein